MVQENHCGTNNVSTFGNDISKDRESYREQYSLKSINKNDHLSRSRRKTLVSESILLMIAMILQVALLATTISGYQIRYPTWKTNRHHQPIQNNYNTNQCETKINNHQNSIFLSSSDDWSSFQVMDDDDEIVFGKVLDKQEYAGENDSQDDKEAVGALRSAPTIERNADPISVPAGSQLELSEETVLGVLAACRNELGTLFGYSAENRGVGITGGVDYVDLDGPSVIVRLKGRFWHTRQSVLDRVANYLQQRIPEIVDVQIEDPWQLTNEANDVW